MIRPLLCLGLPRMRCAIFALLFTAATAAANTSPAGIDWRISPQGPRPNAIGNRILLAEIAASFEEDEWDDEFDFEDDESLPATISDPLAPWNRMMFRINDQLYVWVFKPLARGYTAIMPNPIRRGISNFFYNLTTPLRFVSCILQGKGDAAGGEFSRFVVNSTIGLLGFLDMTQAYPELNPKEEDLGQVLGVWGVGNGPYLFWPLLGPSTLRDTIGLVGGRMLDPVMYVDPTSLSAGVAALDKINALSFRTGDYEALKDAALEPYEAFRDAYIQHREKSIAE